MIKAYEVLIKPFSINKARQGRQFNTPACNEFKVAFGVLLNKLEIPPVPDGDLLIHFAWGFCYFKSSDYDNPVKIAQDVIAGWLGIDDRRFVGATIRKIKVKRGAEFIRFAISKYNPNDWAGV